MAGSFCGFAACVLGFLVNVLGLSRIVSVGSTNDLLLNLLDENGVLKMTDKLIAGNNEAVLPCVFLLVISILLSTVGGIYFTKRDLSL